MDKIKVLRSVSDKSISHRALMLSSIAAKRVIVKNCLFAEDTVNTMKALKSLGADIKINDKDIVVNAQGKYSLKEPNNILDLGNSGTGMRLLSGLLSGYEFLSVLTGDDSLRSRPMMRIIKPLSEMGSNIMYRNGGYAPLSIFGKSSLNGIDYKSPVASAQVKSAILIAGLFSEERVCVEEPVKSRNHTENMLKLLGVDVEENKNRVCLGKNRDPIGDCEINVPADISSSAFFIVFALLKNNFELVMKDVGLNETRNGILNVLEQSEADYEVVNMRIDSNELVGDLLIRYKKDLKPFIVDKELMPSLIDEIPILSILAAYCDGVSIVKDATELRKKESDRVKAICENLNAVGVKIEEFDDGFKIYGNPSLKIKPAKIETYKDHRIAMSFAILSAVSGVKLDLSENQSIKTSYPGFFEHLNYLMI